MLGKDYSAGICSLTANGEIRIRQSTWRSPFITEIAVSVDEIKTVISNYVSSKQTVCYSPYYLTNSGVLYRGNELVNFNNGAIKEIYGRALQGVETQLT